MGQGSQPEYSCPGLPGLAAILRSPIFCRLWSSDGAKKLTGSAPGPPDGRFEDARFQFRTRSPKFLKKENWSWTYNPFVEHAS